MSEVLPPISLEILSVAALLGFSADIKKNTLLDLCSGTSDEFSLGFSNGLRKSDFLEFNAGIRASLEQLGQLRVKEVVAVDVIVKSKESWHRECRFALSVFLGTESLEMLPNNFGHTSNLGIHSVRASSLSPRHNVYVTLSKQFSELIGHGNNISKSLYSKYKYRDTHPICQVIFTENASGIIENYYRRKHEILSLPLPPTNRLNPKLPSQEIIDYYYDPVFFLDVRHYKASEEALDPSQLHTNFSVDVVIDNICCSALNIYCNSFRLINVLRENREIIRKPVYHLLMASFLQVQTYASSLQKLLFIGNIMSFERNCLKKKKIKELEEEYDRLCNPEIKELIEKTLSDAQDPRQDKLIKASLDAIVCLRKLIKCIHVLEEIVAPMLYII
ncbi:hypothetical protein [Candidatus Ichthyocystis sparus]|uniref:hypothetical protein n=1 Tax=Candidatus Ichthyocystis sparus TaxID=1561004 RepID=UPI000B85ACD0|nr:hypothetical protein [Candidatus Ichthyocystis sparus]